MVDDGREPVKRCRHDSCGLSTLELLIVLAVIGVVGAGGFLLLPRDQFALNQSTQIAARAVQFARFEAVRQDRNVEIRFDRDAAEAVVTALGPNGGTRRFPFDPSGSESVKVLSEDASIVFNARGIATNADGTLLDREVAVRLGRTGTGTTRDVAINLVGSVEIR